MCLAQQKLLLIDSVGHMNLCPFGADSVSKVALRPVANIVILEIGRNIKSYRRELPLKEQHYGNP